MDEVSPKSGLFLPFHALENSTETGMLSTIRVLRGVDSRLCSSLKSLKGLVRCASTLKSPVYPSDADRELVNDEYYEVMEDGILNELEEAVAEDSPVRTRFMRNG